MNAPHGMFSVGAGLLALALAAGCSSPDRPRHRGPDADTPVVRPVAMRGEGRFFGDRLKAEITVSRGRSEFSDNLTGGHGNGGHRGLRGGGPRRVDHGSHADPEEARDRDSDEPSRPMRVVGGLAPAVTIRLRLENASKEPLQVRVADLNSDLGDFAVRPEKVLLAPGQSTEFDPMVSELGVTSDEIPVTLDLRLGEPKETEKARQDIVVKNLFTPGARK